MANTIIRIGIIQLSRPRSRSTIRAIPPWIAPVFIVTPRKPPMTRMNRATSMAPNSSPEFQTLMLPSSALSMPYSPLIGAISESTMIRCGFGSTWWYVPGIGSPPSSVSYWPAGMIQVSAATMTIRTNRIVYADGSANPRFGGASWLAAAVTPRFLPGTPCQGCRGHRRRASRTVARVRCGTR